MFISPNILRLYDRVLADSFPIISTLFDGIAVSKNDPKLKNSVDSIAPEKEISFSASTLFLALSVQANVNPDPLGNQTLTEKTGVVQVGSRIWLCVF